MSQHPSGKSVFVTTTRNLQKLISAALAVEEVHGLRPWTASDLIAFLSQEEGAGKPSNATVYRLLNDLSSSGTLQTSLQARTGRPMPGRPRRTYQLTCAGLEAAAVARRWLPLTSWLD